MKIGAEGPYGMFVLFTQRWFTQSFSREQMWFKPIFAGDSYPVAKQRSKPHQALILYLSNIKHHIQTIILPQGYVRMLLPACGPRRFPPVVFFNDKARQSRRNQTYILMILFLSVLPETKKLTIHIKYIIKQWWSRALGVVLVWVAWTILDLDIHSFGKSSTTSLPPWHQCALLTKPISHLYVSLSFLRTAKYPFGYSCWER